MRDRPRLRVEMSPSRIAGGAIAAAAVAITSLMLALPLAPWTMVAAIVAIGIVSAHGLLRCTGRDVPARIELGLDRLIVVTGRDRTARKGSILDDSYVGECLTTIVWRPDDVRWYAPSCTLLILPDSVDADAFRQLRVVLRYGQPASDSVASGREAG